MERELLSWERSGEIPRFATTAQWHEWLVQSSPFNLVDGAWLSGAVSRPGPLSEVDIRLFRIWADEVGDGELPQVIILFFVGCKLSFKITKSKYIQLMNAE